MQAVNPYLPSWEYVPDGEPYVYGDRLYVFGSHDRFNGTVFCMNDYVCWSAPVDDLSDWRYEGIIYEKSQDPDAKADSIMQAPDVAKGPDGRFYLYYTLGLIPFMAVAVSDNITGPYQYLGKIKDKNGIPVGLRDSVQLPQSLDGRDVFQFDPGIFVDEDKRVYLYTGFSPKPEGVFENACKKYHLDGAYVMELEADMQTIKSEPKMILPGVAYGKGSGFEGHEFFEASSMRKIDGKYYFIYSSILSHELCYAVSEHPDRDFVFGGILVSNGDIGYKGNETPKNYMGNTHGSLVKVKGQWYVFYHRQTNRHQYSRQGCAEKITLKDGHFEQAEITSCGLNEGGLQAGSYPARIACNLWSKWGALTYQNDGSPETEHHPYFTQTGIDREDNGDQYIANMQDGATAGYKYFAIDSLSHIEVWVSGNAEGIMEIRNDLSQEPFARIVINTENKITKCKVQCKKKFEEELVALYFTYQGQGYVNFHSFEVG